MKKEKQGKTYNQKEAAQTIAKSIYKTMLKSIRNKKNKAVAREIIEDIEDDNYVAQVDPSRIPATRPKVLYKGNKDSKKCNNGVAKLKNFLNKREKL